MHTANIDALKDLSVRIDALRRAMDSVMNGTTPDHGKWVGFKGYARSYSALARKYVEVSGDTSIAVYDAETLRSSMNTVWPVQKEIFESIYTATLILSGVLARFDSGASASVSSIQVLLVANLR
jgi:hypothetical protein